MVAPVCARSGRSAQVGLLAYWIAGALVSPRFVSVALVRLCLRSVQTCLWSQPAGSAAQRDAAQHAAPSSLAAAAIVAAWRAARRRAAPRAGPGPPHAALEQGRH